MVRSDSRSNEKTKFDIDRGMYAQIKILIPISRLMPSLESKTLVSPFLFLAIDLPPPPLFQDSVEKNIIPQVTIHSLLAKFDGKTTQVL
jgi:U4/U6.U5 tri-snRNP-associated protein 2